LQINVVKGHPIMTWFYSTKSFLFKLKIKLGMALLNRIAEITISFLFFTDKKGQKKLVGNFFRLNSGHLLNGGINYGT